MKMYYINPYADTAETREVADDLEQWYNLIGCTVVDIVHRKVGGEWFEIICDAEGTFVEDCSISAISGIGNIMLVGALLVCKTDEKREGELRGLTEDEIAHIKQHIHHQGTRLHPEGWPMLCQVEY